MSLFTSIETIQKYLKINKGIDFEKAVLPFEDDAIEKYIIPHLGDATFQLVKNYAEAETPPDDQEHIATLLTYVRRALSRFMLFIASPSLDINIGTTGYTTAETQQAVPASKARVDKFDSSIEKLGWDNIETMLKFLEKNKAHYPEWVASDAYTMHINGLVNTATDFNKEYDIDNSRLQFLKLRPTIRKIEIRYIIPEISKELFDDLVEKIRANDLSEDYSWLLNLLRIAIVNFTVAQSNTDKHFIDAREFLSAAKTLLDSNPTIYPIYAESSAYRGETPDYTTFANDEDSGIVVFGVPKYN